MDDEIERLVVGVRADTAGFARDVDAMRGSLEGPFAGGVERAGRSVEAALSRAIGTGKLGFDDLRKVALAVMADIASAAIRSGLNEAFSGPGGGGSGGSGGTAGLASTILSLFSGSPGRATGGPVSPGRPYMVGERGPELFVPTASGSIASGGGGGAPREVRMAITVNAGAGDAPKALAASSRQVARAVRAALMAGD